MISASWSFQERSRLSMNTASYNRSRRQSDWIFVILCAVGFFLLGVSATLTLINMMRNHVESGPPIQVQLVLSTTTETLAQSAPPVLSQEPQKKASSQPQVELITFRTSQSPKTQSQPAKYRPYVVKNGETLSRLDPKGWKHTCEINKQLGSIGKDCLLIAQAAILLPVSVVESLSLAEAQARSIPKAPQQTALAKPAQKRVLSLEEELHRAGIVRQQFCDHVGNEKSSACEPEQAAAIELQHLALVLKKETI
jgi:hypothetical protein